MSVIHAFSMPASRSRSLHGRAPPPHAAPAPAPRAAGWLARLLLLLLLLPCLQSSSQLSGSGLLLTRPPGSVRSHGSGSGRTQVAVARPVTTTTAPRPCVTRAVCARLVMFSRSTRAFSPAVVGGGPLHHAHALQTRRVPARCFHEVFACARLRNGGGRSGPGSVSVCRAGLAHGPPARDVLTGGSRHCSNSHVLH